MAGATATRSASENVMVYEDPVVQDELFGPVVRFLFWGGFAVMAVSRVMMAVFSVSAWFSIMANLPRGATVPSSFSSIVVFGMIDTFGALAFSGALVTAGLVLSRMPSWGRITMLGVAAVVLIGSNAIAGLGLINLFGR